MARRSELEKLQLNLERYNIESIIGMGGVGKTELAVEYCYENREKYSIIYWIHASSKSNIIQGYLDLAEKLGFTEENSDSKIEKIFEWFSVNDNWLLVFDNIEDMNLIKEVIPKLYLGHYIITSKDKSICKYIMDPIKLSVFSKEEALEFIDKNILYDKSKEDLAMRLGYLPIALEYAVAYINMTAISINEYLQLYEKNRVEILDRIGDIEEDRISIFNTWNLSFSKIQNKNSRAIMIAKLISFFESNNISKEIIYKLNEFDVFGHAVSQLELIELIALLNKYSIINVTSESISMHCIIQEFIMNFVDTDTNNVALININDCLNNILKLNISKKEDIKLYTNNLGHYKRILDLIINNNISNVNTIELLTKMSIYLRKISRLEEALEYAIKAEKMLDLLGDNDNASYYRAKVCNVLGGLYSEKQFFDKAIEYYKLTLAKSEFADDKNLNNIIVYNNIALLNYKIGKYKESKSILNTCLERISSIEEDMNLLKIKIKLLSNLALNEKAIGEMWCAEKICKDVLNLCDKVYDKKEIEYAREINNYAAVMADKGEFKVAIIQYKEALDIFKECLGEINKEISNLYNNLSICFANLKILDRATEFAEKSLEINNELCDKSDLTISENYSVFGYIYYEKEEYEKACLNYLKAINIIKQYDENNFRLIELYISLGKIDIKMSGNNIENNFDNALRITLLFLEKNPDFYFKNILNIIFGLLEEDRDKLALKYCKIGLKNLKNTNIYDAKKYNLYLASGCSFLKNGNYQKALKYYNKCLELVDNNNSKIDLYSNLASVYSFLDNYPKAIENLINAVRIERKNIIKKSIIKNLQENIMCITNMEYTEFVKDVLMNFKY